ncbi:hypothetical protein JHK82_028844 [Glycine max]|nr:hypothetical protein JHK85_029511 [Glycine max]KAG5004827.1 hypothetical protein JHK86_028966 [Glycine max]KAG5128009.1 hypothetical protein JHK82_028844 [Glycine max]KAG5152622.1 hypothetical protein JHK84_029094 [Glycine max]KHN17087.1 hypothetical protein glysoja_011561 [Glycine soja]
MAISKSTVVVVILCFILIQEIAVASAIPGAVRLGGKKCALGHAIVAARSAGACHPALLGTEICALAMLDSPHMEESSSAHEMMTRSETSS